MFIYAGIVDPMSTISNQTYERNFNNDMKYLSPCSRIFFLNYFNKFNWQGWGLGKYEQGPWEIIEVQYQDPTDKRGLGYQNGCKNPAKVGDLEEENLDYNEESLENEYIVQEGINMEEEQLSELDVMEGVKMLFINNTESIIPYLDMQ